MNPLARLFIRSTAYPADAATQSNARATLLDGMAFNVLAGCFLPYVGAFVLAFGGDALAVSLAVALPALVQTVAQLPGARITESGGRRLPVVISWSWASRLAFVPLLVLPWLPLAPRWRVLLFIAVYAYMSFPATVANVAWTSLMGDLFPAKLRGRVFADRNMWLTVVVLLVSAVGGVVVLAMGWPTRYLLLVALTFGGQLVSLRYLAKLREDPPPVPTTATAQAAPSAAVRAGAESHGDWKMFWPFAVAACIFQLGLNWPAGLWPTVFLQSDGLPVFWFGVWNMVTALFTILTARAWGRACDRRGATRAAAAAAAMYVLLPPLYLVFTTALPITLLNIWNGAAAAGLNLALFNGLLETAPPERRPRAVAWFNSFLGLATFAGPLLGVWQYRAGGLPDVLWTAAALRAIGACLLFPPLFAWFRQRPFARVSLRS